MLVEESILRCSYCCYYSLDDFVLGNIGGILNPKSRTTTYEKKKKKISKETHFIICNSCSWCESCLSLDGAFTTSCPVCKNGNVESMPVCYDESYRFDNDKRRGVTLDFTNNISSS